ncbi:MAG: BBP7 family outer membrane beta-barrel protein [Gemmataceae bacterium]
MRNGLLGSIAALAAGAGLAFAQSPAPPAGFPAGQPGTAVAQSGVFEPVPAGPSALGTMGPVEPIGLMAGTDAYAGEHGERPLSLEHVNVQGDYLLAYMRPFLPSYPLVSVGTTGPRGALNGPGTTVLINGPFDFNAVSGGRYTIDVWADRDRRFGAEFSAFVLAPQALVTTYGFGDQIVARPVINADTGLPVSLLVAAPGLATGGVEVDATNRLWGYEANGKFRLWADATKEITVLTGFRYIDLSEQLNINQATRILPAPPVITQFFYGIPFANPFEIDVRDSFRTRNQGYFHQVGIQGKVRIGRWSAMWAAKFNYGVNHETLVINGNSTLFPTLASFNAGQGNTVPGGLLALPSNIGRQHADPFTVMPEGTFQIGYRFTRCVDAVMGYQFLYLSRAIRPGDQINATVGPTQIPTSAFFGLPGGNLSPPPGIKQSDFWMQAVNFGVNIHY